MRLRTLVTLLIPMLLFGCVRREGRNSDCIWPGEAGTLTLNPDKPGYGWHLAGDADFAEELADRYALRNARDIQSFKNAKELCLTNLFDEVGRMHAIRPTEVSRHLGTNRLPIDIVLNLPFLVIYAFASRGMGKRIWRRYPPSEGWFISSVLILLCSLAFASMGVLLGEQWSVLAEALRVGTGHLGIRVSRLLWALHRSELFILLMMLFCEVVAITHRLTSASRLGGPRWRRQ